MKTIKIIMIGLIILIFSNVVIYSKTIKPKSDVQGINVFDMQRTTLSNVDFKLTNNGIIFLDYYESKGGCFWPRGSNNLYIFGGGFWFGCLKYNPKENSYNKMVTMSYNPNSGRSNFIPGSLDQGDNLISNFNQKNRIYISKNFSIDGSCLDTKDTTRWCLWKSPVFGKLNFGKDKYAFVYDNSNRNNNMYSLGPFWIADEDFVSIFKDTDLSYYDGGIASAKNKGYPLRLEVISHIITGDKIIDPDSFIISYSIRNASNDTLRDCFLSKIIDADLTTTIDSSKGIKNDRAKYYLNDPTLNLVVVWTNNDDGEANKKFGYMGISILESPATDSQGFLRQDKLFYTSDEQLGLYSFKDISPYIDLFNENTRYDFISEQKKYADTGPNDIRLLLTTGKFNLKPNEIFNVKVAFNFSNTAKGGDPDGTSQDMSLLINKVKSFQNNFYMKYYFSIKDDVNKFQNDFKVFPNPANDLLKIDVKESNDHIRIYSLNGILVYQSEFKEIIDISLLEKGIYSIVIENKRSLFIKN